MLSARLAAWLSRGEPLLPKGVFGPEHSKGSAGPDLGPIFQDPARRRIHDEIRERLWGLGRPEKDELVSGVLARFGRLVHDLPASERHHHARPFGLLDHTLEIALGVAREFSSGALPISPDPVIQHREGPLWALAGVLGALAHDLGKLLDLDVHAPGGSETWDPFREPLRDFLERHGIPRSDPAITAWKAGRSVAGHEEPAGRLLPLILPARTEAVLGTRLLSVLRALATPTRFTLTPGIPEPAKIVAGVIRQFDQRSAMDDVAPRARASDSRPVPSSPARALPVVSQEAILAYQPPADPAQEQAREEAEDEAERARLLPRSRDGKRDPAECAKRLAQVLHPERYLGILRQMLVSRRLSRNGFKSDAYLDASFVHFAFPRAFVRVHRIERLPWGPAEESALLAFLGALPQVVPAGPDRVPVLLRTRPDVGLLETIRFRLEGFLSPGEAEALGFHAFPLVPVLPEAA